MRHVSIIGIVYEGYCFMMPKCICMRRMWKCLLYEYRGALRTLYVAAVLPYFGQTEHLNLRFDLRSEAYCLSPYSVCVKRSRREDSTVLSLF